MWTPELEVNLFHALKGHKPTGINRYFHMACIHNKMQNATCDSKDLQPKDIWTHLTNMYNIETLNELDELPFPNNTTDFNLPEEMTNPEFMSNPSSPATSIASNEDAPLSRPSNLTLSNLKTSSLASSTPESLASPKRKRTARTAQLSSSSSQPNSPATPGSATKRRR
ncbi:MRG/MORF4L-binding protein-like [Clytia hemisphaerica]|uniref:Uncharacterized protein n=1 Tax=Clytia hemisphaerica TaxID=252671 RepID=A0A7M5X8N1_9CNID|eukprot:TCONS_00049731-protein